MSEISYEFSNVLITGNQIDAFDNSVRETTEESWDAPLYNLVSENAEVLVRCEWLQDKVVTLSEAITAYPARLTRETLPLYISLAYQLLANCMDETKKPVEEDEPEEEEPVQIEEADQKNNTDTEVREDSKTADADRRPEKAPEDAKVLGLPISQSAGSAEPQASYVLAAEAEQVAEPAAGEPKQSIQGSAKTEGSTTVSSKSAARAEAANTSANSSGGKTGANSLRTAVVLPAKSSASLRSETKSVTAKTAQELAPIPDSADDKLSRTTVVIKPSIEVKAPKPALEIPEPAAAADPVVELKAAPDRPAFDTGQEIEAPVLPEILDEVPAPKLTELSTLELESMVATEDAVELSDEIIEAPDVELVPVILEYEAVTDGLVNLVEEEVVALGHFGEDAQEFYQLDISSIPTWEASMNKSEAREEASMKITGYEQLIQVSLTIEEIEDTLIELAQRLEASEPETTEKMNEILDKIIDVPAKLEAHNGENIITEAQAQEELEELFTELLDEMGIDYTPELIESLASLTLKWHLSDEIQKLKNEEETDKAAPGSGTHKIIKKLLVGLSTIKKAIAHACAIGKSALQLYTFNFAT